MCLRYVHTGGAKWEKLKWTTGSLINVILVFLGGLKRYWGGLKSNPHGLLIASENKDPNKAHYIIFLYKPIWISYKRLFSFNTLYSYIILKIIQFTKQIKTKNSYKLISF